MGKEIEKPEFWESSFLDKKEMWGFSPSPSAVATKDFFLRHAIKNILIPGIGYGRNAQVFKDNGITITGIEISQTAIDLLRKHYGPEMTVYHGSVTEMPFDACRYEGIFCHALIHLLDQNERTAFIRACYDQLEGEGYMVFSAISKEADTYGKGTYVSQDRYEVFEGVRLFFFDRASIQAEFQEVGLCEVTEIQENYPFFLITCKKEVSRN